MLEQLIELDKSLFLYLNNLGSESWDGLWLVITNKLCSIPLYAVLLFLIYKKYGWKGILLLVFVVAAMITFTDQITNVFKDTFQRARPCRAEGIMDLTRFVAPRCGKYGFFSGHASNSMAVAIFTGLLLKPYFKNLIYLLVIWSLIVAYSRIYVGVHYPLDILCGLTFGTITGFGFYKLYNYLFKRYVA
ncbi:phosphatase PAP2 family protein [Winogradskyella undariae]|uniref:phosphatase PAP2 family protein n=1 Tax=Winogradskyella TaxID=286104 RepID=UPI00156AC4BC|nr:MULTISPECIES: phosphatase PAP2 family protein [Winogradskyella]NRR91975.1 phosphatase PAP2 family protein [Winogradskyella undariae]QNK78789.1 phosphatase PAP2 family protein [Winogradskyella sp. PAMC22761]QXP78176.1 phosphatase PAP2 family protein [Winogradskyella sp. HaHa_3_26]